MAEGRVYWPRPWPALDCGSSIVKPPLEGYRHCGDSADSRKYKRRLKSTIFKEGGGGGHLLQYITEHVFWMGKTITAKYYLWRSLGIVGVASYVDNEFETPHKLLSSAFIS